MEFSLGFCSWQLCCLDPNWKSKKTEIKYCFLTFGFGSFAYNLMWVERVVVAYNLLNDMSWVGWGNKLFRPSVKSWGLGGWCRAIDHVLLMKAMLFLWKWYVFVQTWIHKVTAGSWHEHLRIIFKRRTREPFDRLSQTETCRVPLCHVVF